MSRKGNCWDNAVAERFFLNLKMERVWQCNYANHAEAKLDVANYIAGFYNCQRLHSVLGNLPPSVYESVMAEKEPIVVSEITCPLQVATAALFASFASSSEWAGSSPIKVRGLRADQCNGPSSCPRYCWRPHKHRMLVLRP